MFAYLIIALPKTSEFGKMDFRFQTIGFTVRFSSGYLMGIEVKMKNFRWFGWVFGLMTLSWSLAAEVKFEKYHNPEELKTVIQEIARTNPGIVKIHNLVKSAGGTDLDLLEIGPEVAKKEKTVPAVFVAANMEGIVPLASEAALFLVKQLIEKAETRESLSWYILPCGNPDAAARYFARPLIEDPRNASPFNDDKDDAADEDGTEDLDGNGLITQMRVKDPEGMWTSIPGNPRLMKKADWSKGEKGQYKLYPEGLDNDGDGEINEDGPGGVNIGIQFPHLFKFFTADGGLWAGSEKESFALIKFVSEHREIGLTFVFGRANFCLAPPRGGRKGEADLNEIKIPKRHTGFLNADPDKTYTMAEIIEMVKPIVPEGMEVDESMIASFLGLGALVNPLPEDLKFYKQLSEEYKEFLKEKKFDAKRLDPPPDKDGSFELWSYYHLGLPSFAMDFWTLPEIEKEKKEQEITPEKLEEMSDEDFIALGEEKIDAFLKSVGAPAQFKAKQVIESLKGGMMDTKRMAEMLKKMPKPPSEEGADSKEEALLAFSDKELGGKGFVEWKPFKHPTLGDVEIGGPVPFTDSTPPPEKIEFLLNNQVPWIFEITKKMARIHIAKTEAKRLGSDVYEIKAWIENTGYLPYPTAMGQHNKSILPVIVTLTGQGLNIVDGQKRSLIPAIDGYSAQPVTWIVRVDNPAKIEIKASTQTAWSDTKSIDLGGV